MRQNRLLKNGRTEPGSIPLINYLSNIFFKKRNQNIEEVFGSDLSASKKPVIWMHAGSWAEAEILRPVIRLFAQERKYTILITFSAPLSADDLLADYNDTDYLFPLPADTEQKAESFVSFAKPSAAIFAMPAFRSGYLRQLKKRNIPTFLIAREIARSLPFPKGCGPLYRNTFEAFAHIFVFDSESKALLDKLGVRNVTADKHLPVGHAGSEERKHCRNAIMERFVANEKFVFIGGNIDTEKDLKLVAHLVNTNPALKCILAPRTISEERLNRIEYELDGFTLWYSECDENTNFDKVQILVTDFVGALSRICHYGSCAYIGGGFTPGLRNVTDAAANGLPISFGPRIRHGVLPECLIGLGVGRIVRTPDDICKWVKELESNPDLVRRINSEALQFAERGFETAHRIYTHINSCL